MPIEFRCEQCEKLLRTADSTAGKHARCPSCGNIQPVPGGDGESTSNQPPFSSGDRSAEAQQPAGAPSPPSPPDTPVVHQTRATQDTPSPPEFPTTQTPQPTGASEQAPASFTVPSAASHNIGEPVTNPYADPTSQPSPTQPIPIPGGSALVAQNKLFGPAIGIIVTAILALGFHGILLVGTVIQFAAGEIQGDDVVGGVFGILVFALNLVLWVVIAVGAFNMKNLRRYTFSMASAILAMVPCGCCFWLGLPFGIWALVAMSDDMVKNSFH